MSERRPLSPATLAARALGGVEPGTRALVPPIHPSAAYARAADGSYPGGHRYTRDQNPGYARVEALLAALEGGADALLFASGMAAGAAVFDTLEAGAHVLVPERMYGSMRGFAFGFGRRRGLAVEAVPNGELDALRAALRPGRTRLVWLESPSNPMGAITDLAAAAEIAHGAGAIAVADGTLATPILCRPLELGCDLVMHSATKQLNGHSDVLAGALVTAEEDALWERIRTDRGERGAVLGPFETWLLQRGLRTLALRVPASARGAQRVAEHLAGHPAVAEVLYPGLPSHPGHAVAARQMRGGFGPVVSFRPRGGAEAARRTAAALALFEDATSLGGVESLVEQRAPVEGPGTDVPEDLLRLSVGIEEPEDLVADLDAALAAAAKEESG